MTHSFLMMMFLPGMLLVLYFIETSCHGMSSSITRSIVPSHLSLLSADQTKRSKLAMISQKETKKLKSSSIVGSNSNSKNFLRIHDILRRIDQLFVELIQNSLSSFTSACILGTLFTMMTTIATIKSGWKPWISKSFLSGCDWGKYSALYVGVEVILTHLRSGNRDMYTYAIASGATSMMYQIQNGPIEALKGFATGFSFIYICSKYLGINFDANTKIDDMKPNNK